MSCMELIVHQTQKLKKGINPFDHVYSHIHMETQGLKQALDKHRFDAAFGGAAGMKKNHVPRKGLFISNRL